MDNLESLISDQHIMTFKELYISRYQHHNENLPYIPYIPYT